MNTWLIHNNSRKWTWGSYGDRTQQMIDYIKIDQRWCSCINNARIFQSATVPNVQNDHSLVMGNFKIRCNVQNRSLTRRVDVERLRISEVRERDEIELKNLFEALGRCVRLSKRRCSTEGRYQHDKEDS
ncbi:hypothetical protein DPMN_000697 [Dreissena polymorpha]|uniref:Uncharacterized protein n=1 Tax=Dreissena polymorpha TaxID=45954 RepID=A0A9D4MII0_DREPO|nr:hypothetical protein DPMN_000697 [Dreissena polymorpha]